MKRKSAETCLGQRSKEKRELFGRFKLRAIVDVYKEKFFALFEHRCFKCSAKERTYKEIGRPAILCIDHHIPMALGGHLIPGNLVALCKCCNNKKLDFCPEDFYNFTEMEKLKPILEQQDKVFSFTFDWDAWGKDRECYLKSLGVEPRLIKELLFNPDHPDYVGDAKDDVGVVLTVDFKDLYVDNNN